MLSTVKFHFSDSYWKRFEFQFVINDQKTFQRFRKSQNLLQAPSRKAGLMIRSWPSFPIPRIRMNRIQPAFMCSKFISLRLDPVQKCRIWIQPAKNKRIRILTPIFSYFSQGIYIYLVHDYVTHLFVNSFLFLKDCRGYAAAITLTGPELDYPFVL